MNSDPPSQAVAPRNAREVVSAAAVATALEQMHLACWGWALACTNRDEQLAADVLQRAYLKILERPERYRGGSSFRTFVFGVIRRTAMEERRRAWLGLKRSDDLRAALRVSDPAAGTDATALRNERTALLLNGLDQLSRRQREVIELVFYHGYSIEEAAKVMGVRLGSARTHYARAKDRLRMLLPGDL